MLNLRIYKGKTVLVTGHTGFKGTWLSIWLNELGAKVVGFSLPEWDNDYLYKNTKLKDKIIDKKGDVRVLDDLKKVFEDYKPDIVFHLAAQPLVRDSYENPVKTFDTNVIGTINVLECIRLYDFVKSGVMITTDKCYKNKEREEGYCESDELGGHDPYSASKACAEIIIESYRQSFFVHQDKFVASSRAGNVIGGGDYSKDRLIPDCIKSLRLNKEVLVRNPYHTRPWQHVLEPLYGYLLLGERLMDKQQKFAGAWNFGPKEESIIGVNEIVSKIIDLWGTGKWRDMSDSNEKKHEARILCLNISKSKKELGWAPKLDINQSIKMTVEWYKRAENENAHNLCIEQIREYVLR